MLSSIVIALLLKVPALGLPFLDQMYYTLILTIVIIAGVSLTTNPQDEDPKAIHTTAEMFKTDSGFGRSIICCFLVGGFQEIGVEDLITRRTFSSE